MLRMHFYLTRSQLNSGVGRTIREDSDVRKPAHQTCHPFCLEISLEFLRSAEVADH